MSVCVCSQPVKHVQNLVWHTLEHGQGKKTLITFSLKLGSSVAMIESVGVSEMLLPS